MGNSATIYSVAQDLGIHASTVSRAFNRPDLVKPEVRERILRRAIEVDYRPNIYARGLITGHTGVIGLLIPDIENPFFPPVVRAVQKAAHKFDLSMMLLDSERDPDREIELINTMRRQMDGLILISPRSNISTILKECQDTPVVLVNRTSSAVPTALIDNSAALRAAGDELLSLRHRKIALLRGPTKSWAAKARASAVRSWAQSANLSLLELGPFEAAFEGGLEAARELAATSVTAVIAFDDLMACGAIAGLAERGLDVPGDISIVGCDDVLLARTLTPALTTVSAPVNDLCRSAVELLRGAAAGEPLPAPIIYSGQFTRRASTGRAPG